MFEEAIESLANRAKVDAIFFLDCLVKCGGKLTVGDEQLLIQNLDPKEKGYLYGDDFHGFLQKESEHYRLEGIRWKLRNHLGENTISRILANAPDPSIVSFIYSFFFVYRFKSPNRKNLQSLI